MADTRFCVQLPELAATAQRLAEVGGHLQRASHRLAGAQEQQVGDARDGLQCFADHWEHGIGLLRRHVGELHAALTSAHDGYACTEQELSRALDDSGP